MNENRTNDSRLPETTRQAGAGYAETDKTEPLSDRRGDANNLFASFAILLPVLLAAIALFVFVGMQGSRAAKRADMEASIKPTPVPSIAPPVNDAGAASRL
jgi:hypothetical protein